MVIFDGKITTAELLYDAITNHVLPPFGLVNNLPRIVETTPRPMSGWPCLRKLCCSGRGTFLMSHVNRHLHNITSVGNAITRCDAAVVDSSVVFPLQSLPSMCESADRNLCILRPCFDLSAKKKAHRPSSPRRALRCPSVHVPVDNHKSPQHPPGMPAFDPAPVD